MQYQRCKCGNIQWWGETPRCASCDDCGSGPGYGPDTHREPEPHDFSSVEGIQTDQGAATITLCRYCHNTRAQIEKRRQAGKQETRHDR